MARQGRRLVVIGAGGHGRVIADLARVLGYAIVGYADLDEVKRETVVDSSGARVVMSQPELLACARGEHAWPVSIDSLALGIGDNVARARLVGELDDELLPILVHPTAWISESARIGAGSVVLAGAIVNTDAHIATGGIVNSRATIEHECILGRGVHVSPAATLCGGVRVGDESWIGAGAVIIPGRKVGIACVVGAGAVVIRDVPDAATVVGNPAHEIERSSIESPSLDPRSARQLGTAAREL